jgi:hypothetical protein
VWLGGVVSRWPRLERIGDHMDRYVLSSCLSLQKALVSMEENHKYSQLDSCQSYYVRAFVLF